MTLTLRRVLVVLALGLAVQGLLVPAASWAEGSSPSIDPVTGEVIRLLGEGLSTDLVLDWLHTSGKRPTAIGADDLIALKKAGASERLVDRYLALVEAAPAAPAPAAAPAEPESPSGPATLEVSLDYRPRAATGAASDWHLFVYLDGDFLIWSPGGDQVLNRVIELEPGHHLVRIMQERHNLVSARKQKWEHEARACLVPIELELKPGEKHHLELEVVAEAAADGGVLAWRLLRGEEVSDESSARGGSFHQWPALCEEILGNIPQRKWDNRSTRNLLVGCSRWDTLWPAVADLPDRHALRKKLQAEDFRPVF